MATRRSERSSRYSITQVCETSSTSYGSGMVYTLKNMPEFSDAKNSDDVTITNAAIHQDHAEMQLTAQSKLEQEELDTRRSLYYRVFDRSRLFGVRTMVVLRVSATPASNTTTTTMASSAPEDSAERISDLVFGTGGDPENLKSRFDACSFHQLTFEPGTGHDFVNGVADISIGDQQNITGMDRMAVQNLVTRAADIKYGTNLATQYDHVVYVLPKGTLDTEGNDWYA